MGGTPLGPYPPSCLRRAIGKAAETAEHILDGSSGSARSAAG